MNRTYEPYWVNYKTSEMDIAELLKDYLTDECYTFEISGCFNCIHFRIFLGDEGDLEQIDGFLDGICLAKERFTCHKKGVLH